MALSKLKAKQQATQDSLTALTPPVQDFLQIWQGLKTELKDPIRLGRLELRLEKAWQGLTQPQKDAAWGLIFPEHKLVREVFGAHAVSIEQ